MFGGGCRAEKQESRRAGKGAGYVRSAMFDVQSGEERWGRGTKGGFHIGDWTLDI